MFIFSHLKMCIINKLDVNMINAHLEKEINILQENIIMKEFN